ncbi:MAG: hypothetical protein LBC68_11565 [Prevotellaceae bacterium]|nr:hypothetical protein [Prevotellaceae bacterium]
MDTKKPNSLGKLVRFFLPTYCTLFGVASRYVALKAKPHFDFFNNQNINKKYLQTAAKAYATLDVDGFLFQP